MKKKVEKTKLFIPFNNKIGVHLRIARGGEHLRPKSADVKKSQDNNMSDTIEKYSTLTSVIAEITLFQPDNEIVK